MNKKYFVLSFFIFLGFFLSCTNIEKEEVTPNRNTSLYNAVDTTDKAQTPGRDDTTLRIQADDPVAYQKAVSPNKKPVSEQKPKYYFGSNFVFDAIIFEDPIVIKHVQEELNQRGYAAGSPDGILGQKTQSALRNFQRQNDIAATGDVNQDTLEAMELELIPAEELDSEQIYAE